MNTTPTCAAMQNINDAYARLSDALAAEKENL